MGCRVGLETFFERELMKLGKNQKKWIKALRSGKYKQTKDHLRDSDGYCCLGIGCRIFKKELGLSELKEADGITSFNSWRGSLPEAVEAHLGLRSNTGKTKGRGKDLAARNDNGWTFHEIANFLVKYPAKFFKESK